MRTGAYLRRLAVAGAGALLVPQLGAQTVAITGATVYPVSGPKIERGTVVIRDGRIAAVGAGVPIPAGAERIDATGRWVTPGLVHTGTDLGIRLLRTGGSRETREDSLAGDIKAAFNVADAIDPAALTLPVARLQGITSTLAVPSTGLIPGQGAFFDLAGERVADLVAKSPAVMVIDFSESAKASAGGSRGAVLQKLRRVFRDALEYDRRRDEFRRGQIQPLAAGAEDLEALRPVLRGELPVLAIANRRRDIEAALDLAQEFGLRLVVQGGAEAWQAAAQLARARVAVVVEPLTDVPRFDALAPRLDNATLLRAAGVMVALAQRDDAHFRNLRQAAGNAVRNGMTWEDALRAVTLGPAEVAGVADRYGSLEPGKVANLVVWSGDPFEFSSRAERVFIRGRQVPPVSRQTELLERYRTLPPAY
ncbi:MAG TPA: amidohydrolase family protein [Gemmatimonadales bacterium]|nr:amidohydrolase family protein [Gemmatimonadales bacterium]